MRKTGITGFGILVCMSNYDEKIEQIKQIEREALVELSRIRAEKDKIVSDYISSLKEKKIENLKNDIQSL